MAREAPPRRESSGSASIALRASPYWRKSQAKVRGPTLSLRMSRSQSRRCSSVRWEVVRSSTWPPRDPSIAQVASRGNSGLLADFSFGAVCEAGDVAAVHDEREHRKHNEEEGFVRRADEPQDDR